MFRLQVIDRILYRVLGLAFHRSLQQVIQGLEMADYRGLSVLCRLLWYASVPLLVSVNCSCLSLNRLDAKRWTGLENGDVGVPRLFRIGSRCRPFGIDGSGPVWRTGGFDVSPWRLSSFGVSDLAVSELRYQCHR